MNFFSLFSSIFMLFVITLLATVIQTTTAAPGLQLSLQNGWLVGQLPDGSSGAVCYNNFNTDTANALCGIMGYSASATSHSTSEVGFGNLAVSNLACPNGATSVSQCFFDSGAGCIYDGAVHMTCYGGVSYVTRIGNAGAVRVTRFDGNLPTAEYPVCRDTSGTSTYKGLCNLQGGTSKENWTINTPGVVQSGLDQLYCPVFASNFSANCTCSGYSCTSSTPCNGILGLSCGAGSPFAVRFSLEPTTGAIWVSPPASGLGGYISSSITVDTAKAVCSMMGYIVTSSVSTSTSAPGISLGTFFSSLSCPSTATALADCTYSFAPTWSTPSSVATLNCGTARAAYKLRQLANNTIEVQAPGSSSWGSLCVTPSTALGKDGIAGGICSILGKPTNNPRWWNVPATGPAVLSNLFCPISSPPTSLSNCTYMTDTTGCTTGQGVAVVCDTSQKLFDFQFGSNNLVQVKGPGATSYGPVCGDFVENNTVAVLCTLLGYSSVTKPKSWRAIDPAAGTTTILRSLKCPSATATSIFDCTFSQTGPCTTVLHIDPFWALATTAAGTTAAGTATPTPAPPTPAPPTPAPPTPVPPTPVPPGIPQCSSYNASVCTSITDPASSGQRCVLCAPPSAGGTPQCASLTALRICPSCSSYGSGNASRCGGIYDPTFTASSSSPRFCAPCASHGSDIQCAPTTDFSTCPKCHFFTSTVDTTCAAIRDPLSSQFCTPCGGSSLQCASLLDLSACPKCGHFLGKSSTCQSMYDPASNSSSPQHCIPCSTSARVQCASSFAPNACPSCATFTGDDGSCASAVDPRGSCRGSSCDRCQMCLVGGKSKRRNGICGGKGSTCSCDEIVNGQQCSAVSSAALASCVWCANMSTSSSSQTGFCANASTNPAVSNCSCASLTNIDVCPTVSSCAVFPEMLTLPESKARKYCESAITLNAACPPHTCAGLLTEASCDVAGCTWSESSQSCTPGECFRLFLPGLFPQPVALLATGFLKDVLTLCIIGRFGGPILRWLHQLWGNIRKWWNPEAADVRMDRSVYISDPVCRDGCNFPFASYLQHVAHAAFRIEIDGKDLRRPGAEKDFDPAVMQRKLLDAIAYVCTSDGLWIFVPDLINRNAERREKRAYRKQLFESELSHLSLPADEQPEVVDSGDVFYRRSLEAREFESLAALQEVVADKLRRCASEIVYYTASRNEYINTAQAVNSMPSYLQVLWYSSSIILLFAVTLFDVAVSDKNRKIIITVNTHCAANATANATTAAPASESFSKLASTVGTASFLLIMFRLVNASAISTACLVFVKTARGLIHYFRNTWHELPLEERLPLIALYTDRRLQGVLAVYFLLLAPFMAVGPVYSYFVSWLAAVPIFIGTAALIVVFLALYCYSKIMYGSNRRRRYADSSDIPADAAGGRSAVLSSGADSSSGGQNLSTLTSAAELEDIPVSNASRAFVVPDSNRSLSESNNSNSSVPVAAAAAAAATGADDDDDQERDVPLLEGGENSAAVDAAKHDAPPQQRQQQQIAAEGNIKTLLRDLGEFLLKEEIIIFIVCCAIQFSCNFVALLHNAAAFGLSGQHDTRVFALDYNARSFSCIFTEAEQQASRDFASLTSVVPFF